MLMSGAMWDRFPLLLYSLGGSCFVGPWLLIRVLGSCGVCVDDGAVCFADI